MPSNEQRRQKKLAKKRTKERAAKKQQARQKNQLQSFAGKFQLACEGRLDRCLISQHLFQDEQKMGTVMLTRRMPDGRLGCVRFLVDAMCLGVKSSDAHFVFPTQLSEMLAHLSETDELRDASPPVARKLIEDAIAYARQFGLEPCASYHKHEPIWGDIDASECETEFHFGDEDGQPFYTAGPHETRAEADRIIKQLETAVGVGNFCAIGVPEDSPTSVAWDDPELDVDIDEDVDDTFIEQLISAPDSDDEGSLHGSQTR